jgi:hypothetical protein
MNSTRFKSATSAHVSPNRNASRAVRRRTTALASYVQAATSVNATSDTCGPWAYRNASTRFDVIHRLVCWKTLAIMLLRMALVLAVAAITRLNAFVLKGSTGHASLNIAWMLMNALVMNSMIARSI